MASSGQMSVVTLATQRQKVRKDTQYFDKGDNLGLASSQVTLAATVEWVSLRSACDLDLSCALLDAKGNLMEIIGASF